MTPQKLNPEEVFEDKYTNAFKDRFTGLGLLIKYDRDRAAKDLAFQLTAPGSLELSNVRVWFQLKGIHRETLGFSELTTATSVPVDLDIDDVKKWYAAPEAVYIVVYLETLDEFIGEDIRDMVDRRFADHRGSFASKMDDLSQKSLTLHVDKSAVIDEERIASMLRHRSMRIDDPGWRGRPLGHRFDPVRCELATLEPHVFVELIEALLTAHDFRINRRFDAGSVLKGAAEGADEAYLSVGTMYLTYEWLLPMSVEFGVSPDTDFREEGQTFSVQGKTAVLVHARFGAVPEAARGADQILRELRDEGVEKLLVIANAPEALLIGPYRSLFGDLCEVPQGQGSLAYSVLTAPLVFMDFQDRLKWKFVNYL